MAEDVTAPFEINPQLWADRLFVATEGHIGAMRIVLSTLDDGSYIERISPSRQVGLTSWVLVNVAPPEILAKEERRKALLAISRSFVDFVDTMIAIQNLSASPLVATRPLRGLDQVSKFVQEVVDAEAQGVGRDRSLSIPKKIARFPSIDPFMKDAFTAMFLMRNALEHHKGIAQQDIALHTRRLMFLKNGMAELDESNSIFEVGETIEAVIRDQTKTIRAGEEIDLSEEEIEWFVRHVTLFLVPQLAKKQEPVQHTTES